MKISVLGDNLQKTGELELDEALLSAGVSYGSVYHIVNALRANRRSGTAATKTRGLVSGGGAKPYKQKGTGRARQGSTRSPLLVGGGTTFGPVPRSFAQKINKTMMRAALRSLLVDKFQSGKLCIVEKVRSTGKTSYMSKTLNEAGLRDVLIVASNVEGQELARSVRNLPTVKFLSEHGISAYEILRREFLLIEREIFNRLVDRLK